MKIFVLGAAGFIGSHLTLRLLREGHTVTAMDLQSEKVQEALGHPNLTFLQADIRTSANDLERWIRESYLVIDLIAYANPGLYVRIPLEVFRLNFTENLKIAEACVPVDVASGNVLTSDGKPRVELLRGHAKSA